MGKKSNKTAAKSSKDNAEIAKTAWAGNKGGTMSSTTKILAGISVGQMVMVVVSAATLGVFVNSNMEEIGMLKQTTENMQNKIDLLESKQGAVANLHHSPDNETKWRDIETKVADVQAKHETDFQAIQAISNNLSELVRETATHNFAIQDQNIRITQLELELTECACNGTIIQNHDTRISQLVAGNTEFNATIQTLKAKTLQLDIARTEDQENVQTINNTMAQLTLNFSTNDNRIDMQSIKVAKLESDRDLLNTSITQLQADLSAQTNAVNDQNLTLMLIEEHTVMNTDLIQNISDRLPDLDNDKYAPDDFSHNLDLRVSYLEDGLNCTWGEWTALSNCSSDGTRYRERTCESQNPGFTGMWCSRKDIDIQTCNTVSVNGGWGEWSAYSTCSKSCVGGTETRVRACDSPSPAYGGQSCIGNPDETRSCNDHLCIPADCSEIDISNPSDGRYTLYLERNPDEPLDVRCQFYSDGAWTVIQKRGLNLLNFYRNWADYKNGFGSNDQDHWLGNENIHKLTSGGNFKLKIELTDWSHETKHAVYDTFWLASESDNYRITVYGCTGDAGDGLSEYHNGMPFSTFDADHDNSIGSCATERYGAWWYNSCGASCLNGKYYHSSTVTHFDEGIKWSAWHKKYSFRFSTMMIQKK